MRVLPPESIAVLKTTRGSYWSLIVMHIREVPPESCRDPSEPVNTAMFGKSSFADVIKDLERSRLGSSGGTYMPSSVSLEDRGRGRMDPHKWRGAGGQHGRPGSDVAPGWGMLAESGNGFDPAGLRGHPDSGSVKRSLDF